MNNSLPIWIAVLGVTLSGCGHQRQEPDSFPMVIIEQRVYNAYQVKDTPVVRITTADVESIIKTDPKNPIALFAAAGRGDATLTKQLLDRGADPNKQTDFGHFAIHEAAGGHEDVLALLVAAGANVNVRVSPAGPDSPNQWTPLHYAAYGGHTNIANVLLSKGADVNAQDLWGYTPLYYARDQKKTEMIKLLKSNGAKD